MLDYWNPALHVGRRWDGAFLMPESITGEQYLREGPLLNTAGIALMYAVPRRSLRILGRPKSAFGAGELAPDEKRGLELYEALALDGLRKTVKGDTEQGKQLLQAAETRKKDLALSLAKAKQALRGGNPVLAGSIAASADAMCGGRLPACRDILKQVDSAAHKPILEAAGQYETHRWLIDSNPESRGVIEQTAARRDAGIHAAMERARRPGRESRGGAPLL